MTNRDRSRVELDIFVSKSRNLELPGGCRAAQRVLDIGECRQYLPEHLDRVFTLEHIAAFEQQMACFRISPQPQQGTVSVEVGSRDEKR